MNYPKFSFPKLKKPDLRTFPFYPVLAAAFPAISLFSHNFDQLPITELFLPWIVTVVLGSVLFMSLSLILRSIRFGAAVSCVLIVIFFSYGSFVYLIRDIPLLNQAANRFYFITAGLLVLLSLYLIFRFRRKISTITLIANILTVSVLSIPIITVFFQQVVRLNNRVQISQKIEYKTESPVKHDKLPDIYYIIMDRYASSESLKNYFNFENSEFIGFLKDNGFYIRETNSNYPFTQPSVASSLNMNYLNELIQQTDINSTDYAPIDSIIKENEVVHYLKSWGYQYYHFGAEVGPTAQNKNADLNYTYWEDKLHLNEFSRILLNQTAYFPFQTFANEQNNKQFSSNGVIRRRSYNLSLDQFVQVNETVSEPGPKFVFVHSLITHDPYVVNEDGSYLTSKEEQNFPKQEIYLRQVKFANTVLKKLILSIQEQSTTPPVIILQSDEGPFSERAEMDFYGYNWKEASTDELKLKFGIVNAYFLPGVDETAIPNQITPVNTFRMIFNHYMGEELPLLENRSYGWKDKNHPFDVFEVTDKLR